jgi:hypothetical protein
MVATVTGLTNPAVAWSLQEGNLAGSITGSGAYTAPTNVWGTIHVVATSVADPTLNAVAEVQVDPPPNTGPSAGIFTAIGNMTTARVYHSATLLNNGKVLIAGGWDGSHAVASAELYDPATRTFTPTGSMTAPRWFHTAALLADGRVLIAGGSSDDRSLRGAYDLPTLTAEIYDPSSGTFTKTGDLIEAGGGVTCYFPGDLSTLLPDGRVFIASNSIAELYDPESGTFSLTGRYLSATPFYPNTVTLLSNGKVLFNDISDSELFDPHSGTFAAAGPMVKGSPDFGYTAALLGDGRVFFLGSNDSPSSADVELYDPPAGTFALNLFTSISQAFAPASRLSDGTVLIAGGEGGVGGIPDATLFVPSSGALKYAGSMTIGRHSHKSTALPDNTVLITGGWNIWNPPNQPPTASAEVYTPR